MDTEEIANLVRKLKLSQESITDGVTSTKEEAMKGAERLEKIVVGKIFARRVVNKETLRTHIPRILRARGGTEIEIIGHNMFVVKFGLAVDKKVALEGGPWHFFQDLMILKKTKSMQSVAEVDFKNITMWIQCHNVPMACVEPNILRRIGEKVGEVEEIDSGEGGINIGKTVRIRITRSLEKPFVRCVPISQEDTDRETLVIIQYEKLPIFVFHVAVLDIS